MKAIGRYIYLFISILLLLCLTFVYFSNNNTIHNDLHNNIIINNSKNLKFTPEQINRYQIKSAIDDMILKTINKPIDPKDFNDIRSKVELHTYLWRSIFGEYENDPLVYRNKIIEKSTFLIQKDIKKLKWDEKILASLHQSLYPWVYGFRYHNLGDIIKSSSGKGIVMCVGNDQFKYAISTIDSFRNILNCKLPIEIFYNGDNDLSKENRNKLLSYDDVYVSDLTTYFDNEVLINYSRNSKPFSILASRFEEVMLMDADVVYLRNPAELYKEEDYKKVGTLFFMDRTVYSVPSEGIEWLSSWMNNPLPETANSRFLNGTSTFEMEPSTIIIRKSQTILGLLATCKLNEQKIHEDVVSNMVYSDKETYWIGFDMARQHYYMEPTPSVYIGKVNENNQICGHLGHAIHDKLYYWKGHLVIDNYDDKLKYDNFDTYFYDYIGSQWSEDLQCLIIDKNRNPPHKMTNKEMNIYTKILEREKLKYYKIQKNE